MEEGKEESVRGNESEEKVKEEISMEKILPIKPKKTPRKTKKAMSQKQVGESVWKDIDKNIKTKETTVTLGVIANEIEGNHIELVKEKEEMLNEALYKESLKKKEEKKAKEGKSEKKKAKKIKIKPEKVFFNNVKLFLDNKGWEILRVEKLNKKEIFAKIRDVAGRERPRMLAAFNKAKITEKDILNAHKNLSLSKMPYYIISKGGLPKKIQDSIDAHQRVFEVGVFKPEAPVSEIESEKNSEETKI